MNSDRVRQLLALDDELDIFQLPRANIPIERWYLVDRRCWLIAVIERMFDTEVQDGLFRDED